MTKICPVCGKNFIIYPYQIKKGKGKLCSPKCQHEWRRGRWHQSQETKDKLSKIGIDKAKKGTDIFSLRPDIKEKCHAAAKEHHSKKRANLNLEKICAKCGKKFLFKFGRSHKSWLRQKFCSITCLRSFWETKRLKKLQNKTPRISRKGIKLDPNIVEKRIAKQRGVKKTHEKNKIGCIRKGVKIGCLRDPNGVLHYFKNLTHFVREHEHFFKEEDVQWKYCPKKNNPKTLGYQRCRASAGLLSLFGSGKKVPGSWKGWTVFSEAERDLNLSQDLLHRQPIEPDY